MKTIFLEDWEYEGLKQILAKHIDVSIHSKKVFDDFIKTNDKEVLNNAEIKYMDGGAIDFNNLCVTYITDFCEYLKQRMEGDTK